MSMPSRRSIHFPGAELALQPQEVVQVEKNGTRVRMHITTFTMNPEVSEAQLELHVPAGTKVVHPLK